MDYATFGPAGNGQAFYDAGWKHTAQAPAWLHTIGLDAYEYQCGQGVRGSEATFREIGEKAVEYGIRMSLHAPYFISLSSVEEEKRKNSILYIRDSIHAAEILGADTVVIHTGSAAKLSREKAVELAKDTMDLALCEIGNTPVHFGLETMGKLNQLGTLEEVLEICSISDALYPVVDFGHLNAREQGCFFTADDYRRVFDRIATVLGDEKARHLHCHFSKIEYTKAGEKQHLTFADTQYGPPFEPLMEAIARDGLAPRIICESSGTQAEDALTMKQYYRSLLGA